MSKIQEFYAVTRIMQQLRHTDMLLVVFVTKCKEKLANHCKHEYSEEIIIFFCI